jgi:hypothetical protein
MVSLITEKGERKMLNIEYKAETEDNMADLLQSLLMVRSIAFLSKKFLKLQSDLPEGYYEMQEAMDNIQMLIEPAITHISNEMMTVANQSRLRNKTRSKKPQGGKNVDIK